MPIATKTFVSNDPIYTQKCLLNFRTTISSFKKSEIEQGNLGNVHHQIITAKSSKRSIQRKQRESIPPSRINF